jgi:hypothetical protein
METFLKTPSAQNLNQSKVSQTAKHSFLVTDSITGVSISVEAENEKEALRLFREKINGNIKLPLQNENTNGNTEVSSTKSKTLN